MTYYDEEEESEEGIRGRAGRSAGSLIESTSAFFLAWVLGLVAGLLLGLAVFG